MINAKINGEDIVIPTDLEMFRDGDLEWIIAVPMANLFRQYYRIANSGTTEGKDIEDGIIEAYESKKQDNANERTLRYIAEKVLKDKDYILERIDNPEATKEEIEYFENIAY